MNETEFNAVLRPVLRANGLVGLHIREADEPGVSDLVIWKGRILLAWAELKVDDRVVEPHQHQFLMDREREAGNAYLIRLSNLSGLVRISRPVPEGFIHVTEAPNVGLVKWAEFFQKHRREV